MTEEFREAVKTMAEPQKIPVYQTSEIFVYFADVAWVDPQVVTVVLCGAPNLRMAYDRVGHASVSFEPYREAARANIRLHYSLPDDIDPLVWACSSDGVEQFSRKFPGARY